MRSPGQDARELETLVQLVRGDQPQDLEAAKQRALSRLEAEGAGLRGARRGTWVARVGIAMVPRHVLSALGVVAAVGLSASYAVVPSGGLSPATSVVDATPAVRTMPAPEMLAPETVAQNGGKGPQAHESASLRGTSLRGTSLQGTSPQGPSIDVASLPPALEEPWAVPRAASNLPTAPHRGPSLRSAPQGSADELPYLERAREFVSQGSLREAENELARYRNAFPNGAYRDEATVIALEFLNAAGQKLKMANEAGAFLRAHPNSPYAQRVRSLLLSEGDGP